MITTLVLHLSTITQPAELILDEQHYVPDALSIINNHTTLHPEHTPLGKLFIASGIILFGDNPVGWRIFSVVFGSVSIVLFYFICRGLSLSRRTSSIATFLLALDNLTFVQASVTMLDVYCVTFMLASFLLYLKGRFSLAAVAVALSALAKMTGFLAAGVIGLHWLITFYQTSRVPVMEAVHQTSSKPLKEWLNYLKIKRREVFDFIASMILAPACFIFFMPVFDFLVYRRFLSPVDRILEMVTLMSSLTFANATHESMSRPWEWVILPKIMPYWYTPRYVGAISFTIWALIIPTVIYLGFRAARGSRAGIFGLSWFICTYVIWIPLSIITDRISFVFYFYPTVGAICIGLG
ncbi:MAG: phospholipid carrier-dependent glycosyltransferase, partial [Chloroflexota bacterium]